MIYTILWQIFFPTKWPSQNFENFLFGIINFPKKEISKIFKVTFDPLIVCANSRDWCHFVRNSVFYHLSKLGTLGFVFGQICPRQTGGSSTKFGSKVTFWPPNSVRKCMKLILPEQKWWVLTGYRKKKWKTWKTKKNFFFFQVFFGNFKLAFFTHFPVAQIPETYMAELQISSIFLGWP